MRRRLFNLAAATTLVLFGAMVLLWVRSYKTSDMIWLPVGEGYGIGSAGGDLELGRISATFRSARAGLDRWHESARLTPENFVNPHPNLIQYRVGGGSFQVAIPFWIVVLVPLAGFLWFVYPKRISQGRCEHCGYDLRATPERCPECGAAVTDDPRTTA